MSGSTESSATDVDVGADTDVPPKLSALFLIRFDKKVGCVMPRLILPTGSSPELQP